MRAAIQRIGRRRLLVLSDQAVSSASNVVIAVLVARTLSPRLFGAFSVAMIGYQVGVGAVRAIVGEPWLSAHSTDGPRAWRRAAADLAHAALVGSAAVSVVILAVAVVLRGPSFGPLLILASIFPLLGIQDALRHVAVIDRPHLAVAGDLAWLVVGSLGAFAISGGGPAAYVLAWGLGGVVGIVPLAVGLDVRWHRGNALRWFRAHRGMASAFLGEFLSARAVGHGVVLSLGVVAGYGAVGAVRASQVFYGPLNTIFGGLYLALVPDGARRRDDSRRLLRFMVYATAVVVAVAASWTLVGITLPDRWGSALFGGTWEQASELMLAMGAATVAGSAATGAFAGLRSLGAYRVSLRARLMEVPSRLVLSLGGAVFGSALGFAVGFAISHAIMAVVWWAMFLGVLRAVGRQAPATAGEELDDIEHAPFQIVER